MANGCYFQMMAEGTGKAIDELLDRLTDYEHAPHFCGIYEMSALELVPRTAGTRLILLDGCCAWSVFGCLVDPDDLPNTTTLKKTSQELGIEIEVFSSEPMMAFAEHIHYTPDGKTCVEDSIEWHFYNDWEDEREDLVGQCESFEDYARSKGWSESVKEDDDYVPAYADLDFFAQAEQLGDWAELLLQ